MIDTPHLIQVCWILNRYGVTYAVSGGYACALNGHVRFHNPIIRDTMSFITSDVPA
jgi:hypothetical protein